MEFCDEFECADCCIDARVPLLNKDIDRIVMHGYYDAYFVDECNGIKTIRTRDDGSCVFYNKTSGLCDVYPSRPERCRLNPYTICEKTHEPTVDKACRFSQKCQEDPTMHERMSEYLAALQKEIEWRRRTGHF